MFFQFMLTAPDGMLSLRAFQDTFQDLTSLTHGTGDIPDIWANIPQEKVIPQCLSDMDLELGVLNSTTVSWVLECYGSSFMVLHFAAGVSECTDITWWRVHRLESIPVASIPPMACAQPSRTFRNPCKIQGNGSERNWICHSRAVW